MELAAYMRNNKTGEERIAKIKGVNASIDNWHCTLPDIKYVVNGYYKKVEEQ